MAKKTTRKVRGRGKTIEERIRQGLNSVILEIIRNGQVVEDDDGNLVRVHPSAAMLRVIADRVRVWEREKKDQPLSVLEEAEMREVECEQALKDYQARVNPVGTIRPEGV